MSRIIARPTALLDGTPEAAIITLPNSDARRYVDRGDVATKLSGLVGTVMAWSRGNGFGLPGYLKPVQTPEGIKILIQGEPADLNEYQPAYGFSFGPDGAEFLEMTRHVGDQSERLAWLDYRNEKGLVFLDPAVVKPITDPAHISELTQIVATAEDAAEWTLD